MVAEVCQLLDQASTVCVGGWGGVRVWVGGWGGRSVHSHHTTTTVEPPNNRHVGIHGKCPVSCSEVVYTHKLKFGGKIVRY